MTDTGTETMHRGRCLCGGVSYEVRGALRGVIACHCSQCRRTSGHHAAMTRAPTENLTLLGQAPLTWYRSSATAERGFCSVYGSNVFWRADAEQFIYITAGTLDQPTGLATIEHIFVDDKGDYYAIDDDAPQCAQWN